MSDFTYEWKSRSTEGSNEECQMMKEWDWGWMLAVPVGLVSFLLLKQNRTASRDEEGERTKFR